MEHYCKGNAFALCSTSYEQSLKMIGNLKHSDIEEIRQLPSFRIYVESNKNPAEIIDLLENDEYFLKNLKPLLKNVYQYFNKFHCFLRLLFTMLQNLPKNFIGKQLRDIYSLCSSTNIFQTESFTELWQLLTMLSKDEFLQTLNSAINTLNDYKDTFCLNEVIGKETRDLIDEVSRCGSMVNIVLTKNKLFIQVVEKLTDCTIQISKTDTTTETVKSVTPIKLSKDYKEELKNVCTHTNTFEKLEFILIKLFCRK